MTAHDVGEAARLGALRALEIVGTAPDPQFDAVCSLAQTVFKVPTVLISLIEADHQWFKARCGFEPEGTSRSVSFCDYVIATDDVMVVEDATQDARFETNPLVTADPCIRFYAGAPLVLSPGIRVGTVCVIDVVPRRFTPEDRRKLEEFATIVVALLRLHDANVRQRKELVDKTASEAFARSQADELSRREVALREANARLEDREHELTAVLDNMPAIIGYLDKDLRVRFANKLYEDWYGTAPGQHKGRHVSELIGDDLYQSDLPHMEAALGGRRQKFERRMSAGRHVVASYIPDFKDGVVLGFFVLIVDITERKLAEDKLQASKAFQDRAGRIAGIGAWEVDLATKAVTFSDETRRIHEIEDKLELYHEDALRFYPPEARVSIELAVEASIKTGRPWDLELPLVTAKGRSIWVRTAGEAEFRGDMPVRLVGVFQDITSRYLAERRIREQELHYRLLAENASDMIVRLDLRGNRLFVSPSSTELTGYTPDELVGTRPRDAIHPDDVPRFEAMLAGLIAGEREQDVVSNRLRHKNGTYIWVEATWRVLRDAEGRPAEFVAAVRDISARYEAEERLKARESLYRALMDSLPQIVWVVEAADRKRTYGNQRYYSYYGPIGPTRDERVSHNHPEDLERMEETWRRAAAEGRTFDVEGRIRRHDGVYRWHKLVATPVIRDGEIVEWLGTALDIDEIIVGRQKLKETSDLLSLSQEAAGAGFFDLDLVTNKVFLSRESAVMHGLEGDGVIESDLAQWRACVEPDDGNHAIRRLTEACSSGKTYSAEFRVVRDGKPVRWIHGIGRAQYDKAGNAVRVIGLNFDITDRKTWEAKLIEAIASAETARHDAEKASAAKSDFLANMSHEIRTPLNSIIGYTDLLIEGGGQGTAGRQKLDLIKDSGSALLTIVNDILDFSKIEAGEIDLDPIPFSLEALVNNVLAMVSGIAGAGRLTIERDLAADLPASVCGDVGRLRQILLNLLNNAVKFTSVGTVRLVVLRETSRQGICRLRFVVMDTGIGIPSDRRERLFQRFSQVDGSIARRFGGTGLGLAICKSLVERMGGSIGVESTEGVGSSFWFTIALPIVATGPEPVEALPLSALVMAARILLVEDVVANQDLARFILEAAGYCVEVAFDGVEAMAMVQTGRFELVLMDIQMPGMDGVTATRRIRALNAPCSSIPIIAMTANVLPEQIARFKEAGMDGHVGKPFKRAELYATVAHWTQRGVKDDVASDAMALDRSIFDDLRAMLGDEICTTLLGKFAAELDARFLTMSGNVDRDRLAADAHAMCSSAGSLGFTSFSDLCREVESVAKKGDDLEICVAALNAARGRILRELSSLTL